MRVFMRNFALFVVLYLAGYALANGDDDGNHDGEEMNHEGNGNNHNNGNGDDDEGNGNDHNGNGHDDGGNGNNHNNGNGDDDGENGNDHNGNGHSNGGNGNNPNNGNGHDNGRNGNNHDNGNGDDDGENGNDHNGNGHGNGGNGNNPDNGNGHDDGGNGNNHNNGNDDRGNGNDHNGHDDGGNGNNHDNGNSDDDGENGNDHNGNSNGGNGNNPDNGHDDGRNGNNHDNGNGNDDGENGNDHNGNGHGNGGNGNNHDNGNGHVDDHHETHDHSDEENSGHDHARFPHGHGGAPDWACPIDDMNNNDHMNGDDHGGQSSHNHDDPSMHNHEGHSNNKHDDHSMDNHDGHSNNNHDDHSMDNHDSHSSGRYDGQEGDCPDTTHEFNGKDWYIELMKKSPDLKDITLCTFAMTNDQGILSGAIASIYSDGKIKKFIVAGKRERRKSIIRVIIDGQVRNFKNALPANEEVHMCIVTSTEYNTASLYLNGDKKREIKYFRINGLPSGRVQIGHTKDDKFPMYTGRLRNFMIWNKVLTAEEINKIYSDNHCPSDAKILLMSKDIVPLKANVPIEACPRTEYNFDNTDHAEYLELNTLPEMKFLTVCAQVTTNVLGIIPGTIASYSTKDQPEALSVGMEMDSNGKASARFTVAGQTKKFVLGQFMPNTSYRMCLVYHLQHNHLMTYIDGKFSLMTMFDNVNMLPGGGIVIVGQRQTRLGGCFDKKLAYTGRLTDFMIWTRAFSLEDIAEYTAGNCPTDAALTTNKHEVIPHGMLYSYGECPKREFTLNNQGNVLEYISVAKTLPTTNYLTICASVEIDANGMIPGAIGSYYTESTAKAIVIAEEMSGTTSAKLQLTVNGKTLPSAPIGFRANTDYHICISYHSPHKHALVYINGHYHSDTHFHDMRLIEGGGEIILGQVQECKGGCFERDHAYTGRLSNFMVWNRALSEAELRAIQEGKCPDDHIIDLTGENAAKVSSIIMPGSNCRFPESESEINASHLES